MDLVLTVLLPFAFGEFPAWEGDFNYQQEYGQRCLDLVKNQVFYEGNCNNVYSSLIIPFLELQNGFKTNTARVTEIGQFFANTDNAEKILAQKCYETHTLHICMSQIRARKRYS